MSRLRVSDWRVTDTSITFKLKLGETDCTVYEWAYSGDVAWDSRLQNVTGAILTRQE